VYARQHREPGDFTELFEGGFEVVDDFLGENIRIGEIVGFFEALVSEPENVEAVLVAAIVKRLPTLVS
jgi:hypothetical protein